MIAPITPCPFPPPHPLPAQCGFNPAGVFWGGGVALVAGGLEAKGGFEGCRLQRHAIGR